jgi:hypothetical protein
MNLEKINISEDKQYFEVWEHNKRNSTLLFSCTYFPKYFLSVQKWYGYIEENKIIEIYKILSKHAFDNKQFILGSISDIAEIDGSFHYSNQWVTEKYIPKSIGYGYRYAFFVKPKDLIAELALEDAVESLEKIQGLQEVKIFEGFEEALMYAQEKLSHPKN